MKKTPIFILLTLSLILTAFVSFAQDSIKPVASPRPVNRPKFSEVIKSYADSLKTEREKTSNALAKIDSQSRMIEVLKVQADSRNLRVKDSVVAKNVNVDAVDFMGSTMPLSTYNYIVWGLIALFAAVLAGVISMSAKHRNEAKHRIALHAELSEEFQKFKIKANEKEKKLARELQDERNKLEELRGGA